MNKPNHFFPRFLFLIFLSWLLVNNGQSQILQDDFEGNGTISTWFPDNCEINTSEPNPFSQGINTSAKVLKYKDTGGQYANIGFNASSNFNLSVNHTFSFKIYVPSSGITGTQANTIALKLQNGTLSEPWTTQSTILKPIQLNQWQTLSFNFLTDAFFNQDPNSPNPTLRGDFNRVLIQVNGENNTDQVLAFIDDFIYEGTAPSEPVYDQLVWSDEFNTDGNVNTVNWHQQSQMPGWFAGEPMHYTNRPVNSFVSNGSLKIVAKKEAYTANGQTKNYTSARLNSKFAFTYGKVEIRAKMAAGIGTLPALWMLGKNIDEAGAWWTLQGFGSLVWPACGEIDIIEHWGDNLNFVQSAIHTPSSFGNTENKGGQTIANATTGFHTYVLNWSPQKMVFSVDGLVHYTYNPILKNADTWPFNAEQYILMNVAILPGVVTPAFNQATMEVDYVRVYQEGTTANQVPIQSKVPIGFPNPTDNILYIDLPEPVNQNVAIQIRTIGGQLVKTQKQAIEDNRIVLNDLSALASGLYLVSFEAGGKLYHVKMAKM
jgi:beta-glucanase (GH16 family)